MYSRKELTPKQAQILAFLRDFKQLEGIAPTYREISKHFGFRSTKAASDHIVALQNKGYIRRHENRARSIEVVVPESVSAGNIVSVPLLGEIPAGTPDRKYEDRSDRVSAGESIFGGSAGHRLFSLKVTGESMTGRNIFDGDWIIADADVSPEEGDIVVALIDGDSTLKTLAKKNNSYYLKSENQNHPNWMPMEEITVQGVVKFLIRRV
jgi:repressor LexA